MTVPPAGTSVSVKTKIQPTFRVLVQPVCDGSSGGTIMGGKEPPMPSLADTWENQPLTTLLTPNASDAGERGHLCQRTAAHGGPHGPLRPPPGWPLGDPATGLGCGCLSDSGCPHEGGHGSRGDPPSPGPPTWPRLSHSPGRDRLLPLGPKPSQSIRSGPLQGRAETHPAPTVSAAMETRRC